MAVQLAEWRAGVGLVAVCEGAPADGARPHRPGAALHPPSLKRPFATADAGGGACRCGCRGCGQVVSASGLETSASIGCTGIMKRPGILVAATVLTALAGCGSSGSPQTAPPTTSRTP